MKTERQSEQITIFTPSDADENDTNPQNLTVKEIVARLPSDRFHVTMITEGHPDPRLAGRNNTELVRWAGHGNTLRLLRRCLHPQPDIYFFPRCGPLDRAFFDLRRYLPVKTALVSYIVMMMNESTSSGLIGRSITEADMVCANSEFVAKTIRDRFGVESLIVHDGVDRRFFFPPGQDSGGWFDPPVVLYAGSFQARKRVELVIEQAVRWPNVQFRLAGRGPTQETCRTLAERNNCRNVVFLGQLSQTQLGDEMRNASIFFFPSVLEGHPQVLLQAAACGLPCIAMSLYRPEYVLNRTTGFLVENDEELAEKLEVLITNTAPRRTMSQAAARHSCEFDWDSIAQQWAEIFIETVARRREFSNSCLQAS
jgi:glycosyltransferase involved in cell wall biosynthesis